MHSTAAIHSCPASLPPWRQFGRQGKEKAGHEKMSDHIKKQFMQLSTPKPLCGFCLIPPVEDGRVLLS